MYELRYYVTPDGRQPLPRWIDRLRDRQAKARIKTRLDRLADGNFGDHHDVGDGVYELRIDWGPAYRVYYARIGELVLLLCHAAATSEARTRTSNVRKTTSRTTRPAARRDRAKAAPSASYQEWLIESLKDPKEAAAYLEAAIADGDQAGLMRALRNVAEALGGIGQVAKAAKLNRETLYRTLSEGGNPELRSLTAILGAAGLRLSVKPLPKRRGRSELAA